MSRLAVVMPWTEEREEKNYLKALVEEEGTRRSAAGCKIEPSRVMPQ